MSSKTITSGTVTLCLTIAENAYLYSFLVMEKKRLTDDLAYFELHPDPVLTAQLTEDLAAVNDLIHLVGGN